MCGTRQQRNTSRGMCTQGLLYLVFPWKRPLILDLNHRSDRLQLIVRHRFP